MTDAEFQALRERVVLLPVATAEDVHDLRLLVDEVSRLRDLERHVRALRLADISPAVWVHTWAEIGRLLGNEE